MVAERYPKISQMIIDAYLILIYLLSVIYKKWNKDHLSPNKELIIIEFNQIHNLHSTSLLYL